MASSSDCCVNDRVIEKLAVDVGGERHDGVGMDKGKKMKLISCRDHVVDCMIRRFLERSLRWKRHMWAYMTHHPRDAREKGTRMYAATTGLRPVFIWTSVPVQSFYNCLSFCA